MSKHTRRLVWQMFGRIDDLVFDRDLMTNVLAILDLFDLPSLLCHIGLPTLMPVV